MGGQLRLWITGGVVVLVVVAFIAAPGGDFVWDDVPLIVDDARLSSWSNAREIATSAFWSEHAEQVTDNYAQTYRPVVSLAYLTQWQLFGPGATGFHVTSLLLHFVCILLVAGWLRRRFGDMPGAALFAALVLFALHPSRVESVAWISGSTDLWMTLLALVATALWAKPGSTGRAVAAGAVLGLAILAKEPAVVVPAL